MIVLISGAVIVVLVLIAFSSFNRLASARNAADAAWQEAVVTFEKRRELIPQFIDLLRNADESGAERFKTTMQTRRQASADTALNAVKNYESGVSHEMKNLLRGIAAEPGLKESQAFYDLCARLQDSEDRIEEARKRYNDAVKAYNAVRVNFPMSVFAGLLDFEPEDYFDLDFVTSRRHPDRKTC